MYDIPARSFQYFDRSRSLETRLLLLSSYKVYFEKDRKFLVVRR